MPKVPDQLHTRPPLDRMMQIHERIKAGQYPNCVKLGRDFEVSKRTIIRDLDFMRDRFNLPIDYDSRRYGYYYTRPVEQFPSIAVTEAETFALLVAHKAIAQYHGTPFQRPLEAAFGKLTGALDTTASFTVGNLDEALSFRPFAPDDTDLQVFEVLSRGVQARQAVRFLYKKLGSTTFEKREVRPYHLACIDNRWYLFAHDADRKAIRCFVLARMKEPHLLNKKFEKSKDFDSNRYLRSTFLAFTGNDDYQVVIEFDAWATDLVRGRKWHSTQEMIELPSGGSRLSMRLNSIEEMERFVLGWGTHATVVKPDVLVERIRTVSAEIAQKYPRPQPVQALALSPEPALLRGSLG